MKQNRLHQSLICAAIIAVPFSGYAGHVVNPYMRADAGIAIPMPLHNKAAYNRKAPHSSSIVGLGLGLTLNSHIRTDVAVSYMENFKFNHMVKDPDDTNIARYKQKIRSILLGVGIYYDFVLGHDISPYLSAGLGIAYNQTGALTAATNFESEAGKATIRPAFKLGAGMAYKLYKNTDIDLGYNFHYLNKIQTSGVVTGPSQNGQMMNSYRSPRYSAKLMAHALTLGLRYHF